MGNVPLQQSITNRTGDHEISTVEQDIGRLSLDAGILEVFFEAIRKAQRWRTGRRCLITEAAAGGVSSSGVSSGSPGVIVSFKMK